MSEERNRYFVSPNQDGTWTVKAQGDHDARHFQTKEDAMAHATQIARDQGLSQVVVQREDGTFEEERTYGRDPYPPKG